MIKVANSERSAWKPHESNGKLDQIWRCISCTKKKATTPGPGEVRPLLRPSPSIRAVWATQLTHGRKATLGKPTRWSTNSGEGRMILGRHGGERKPSLICFVNGTKSREYQSRRNSLIDYLVIVWLRELHPPRVKNASKSSVDGSWQNHEPTLNQLWAPSPSQIMYSPKIHDATSRPHFAGALAETPFTNNVAKLHIYIYMCLCVYHIKSLW